LLPAYPSILQAISKVRTVMKLKAPLDVPEVQILSGHLEGVPTYLIEAGDLYSKTGSPYVDAEGQDWPDNLQQFALLGWMAARFADGSIDDWRPDIVHSHDWHTGLAPAYLAARGGDRPATVFTVHNLAYQGEFSAAAFGELALPANFFSLYGLEFYGRVNFMKSGLHYADRITTVSPTYAREIQTPEFAFGMDGVLRSRAGALTGILNGVDHAIWNPQFDSWIASRYSSASPSAKAECKTALRTEMSLGPATGPVFGVISRLTAQKGLDLVLAVLPDLIERGGQLVLLGSGDRELETRLRTVAAQYPGTMSVRLTYDEALAHRIVAGSDVILMPSRFEPCGLTQLYGLAYGSLPLVHRVGGLADTVVDASSENIAAGTATGFSFGGATPMELRSTLGRAFALWDKPQSWAQVRHTAMQQNFGWEPSARRYLDLYTELRPLARSLR
jgi:starch synthase